MARDIFAPPTTGDVVQLHRAEVLPFIRSSDVTPAPTPQRTIRIAKVDNDSSPPHASEYPDGLNDVPPVRELLAPDKPTGSVNEVVLKQQFRNLETAPPKGGS